MSETNEFKFRTKRERQRQTPYSRAVVDNQNSNRFEANPHTTAQPNHTDSLLSRIGESVKSLLIPNWLKSTRNLINFSNNNTNSNSDCNNQTVVNQEMTSDNINISGEALIPQMDNRSNDLLTNRWTERSNRFGTKWPISTTTSVTDNAVKRAETYLSMPSTSSTLFPTIGDDMRQQTHTLPSNMSPSEGVDVLEVDDRSSSSSASASSTSGCSSLVPSHSENNSTRFGIALEAMRREKVKQNNREFGNESTIDKSFLTVNQNKNNPLIDFVNNRNNSYINNNNMKQFRVDMFMTPSSLLPKKSNFYEGKTVFGGANTTRAARLVGNPYNLSQRHLAPLHRINPIKSKKIIDSSDQLSSRSRDIYEKLVKASTPLQDARRVPHSQSKPFKDYFDSNFSLHSKRPKMGGPPTGPSAQTPIPSQVTIDNRFKPMRWELKPIVNKDDNKVSSTEAMDKLINSCDNSCSLIDPKINDSKTLKTNESFGGKIMRKDLRREERRPKVQTARTSEPQKESMDLLKNVEPLSLPSGASLPKFDFGQSSSFEKQSNSSKTLPTTTLTKVDITEEERVDTNFKFAEPVLKKEFKDFFTTSGESFAVNTNEPFVFSSPTSGAITQKPTVVSQIIEKESNILRKSLQKSGETTTPLTFGSIVSIQQNKSESKKNDLLIEKWVCVCLYQNNSTENKCKACNKDRQNQFKPSAQSLNSNTTIKSNANMTTNAPLVQPMTGWGDKFKAPSNSWNCSVCLINNSADKTKCMACEEPKTITAKESPKSDSWKCFYCNENNDSSNRMCSSCDKVKTPKATKEDIEKLNAGQSFKFGLSEEKFGAKVDPFIVTSNSTEVKTDFSNKSITNPLLFKPRETTAPVPTFVFGSTTTTETPKISTEAQVSNSNTATTTTATVTAEPLFKFGLPNTSKSLPSSTSSIVSDIFGSNTKTNGSLFQFGSQPSTTTSASLTTATTTATVEPFVFGLQNKSNDLSKSVSFDFEDKRENKSSSDSVINKSSTETTTGFQFNKPLTEDKPKLFKGFSPTTNSSLFGSATTSAPNTAVTTTASSTTFGDQFLKFVSNKTSPSPKDTQTKSIGSLFGLPSSTTTSSLSSTSFSSPFSANNKFTSNPTPNTTTVGAQPSSAEGVNKNIFSLTPSSTIKTFDSMISSNLSQTTATLDSTSTATTPALPSSLTSSSSQQKISIFGNPNPSLQSFSTSQAPTVTSKSIFPFSLNASNGANTSTTPPDNAFDSTNKSVFGSNASKGTFAFGNTSLNSTQTPGFSFNNPTTNPIANTSSNLTFGLNTNSNNKTIGINKTTNETTNSKPTTNQLFTFGQTSDQFSNPLTQKPLNSNTNPLNSSQFSFGLNSNQTTGQTNSTNLFGNAINAGQSSLSFNQSSTGLQPTSTTPFTFGFGPQSTPSVPQIQGQPPQQQPLPPPQFNFLQQPSFDFGSMAPTGAQTTPGVFQFSADQSAQAAANMSRNFKKAKRRLNPT